MWHRQQPSVQVLAKDCIHTSWHDHFIDPLLLRLGRRVVGSGRVIPELIWSHGIIIFVNLGKNVGTHLVESDCLFGFAGWMCKALSDWLERGSNLVLKKCSKCRVSKFATKSKIVHLETKLEGPRRRPPVIRVIYSLVQLVPIWTKDLEPSLWQATVGFNSLNRDTQMDEPSCHKQSCTWLWRQNRTNMFLLRHRLPTRVAKLILFKRSLHTARTKLLANPFRNWCKPAVDLWTPVLCTRDTW